MSSRPIWSIWECDLTVYRAGWLRAGIVGPAQLGTAGYLYETPQQPIISEYWELVWNDKLIEAMDYAEKSGLDQFGVDMARGSPAIPAGPTISRTGVGHSSTRRRCSACRSATTRIRGHRRPSASDEGRAQIRRCLSTVRTGLRLTAANRLRKALPIGVQYVTYIELEAATEEVRRVSVTSDTDPVLYEVRDSGVAVLTLNRPERMNGWGGGLATAFYERLDDAEADPAVRAIVVTGKGRAFCAGADMGGLNTISNATVDGAGGTDVGKLVGARHPHFVMTMRKPVVAAINGACAGMGLTMALVCDVRFAAAGAKFTTSFARRGLIAEYGISWILPRVVGWGTALDLLLSGRVFLADEAAELRLVKEVVPPDELLPRAIGYAEDIAANCAPSSLAVIKQQVYADTMRDVFEASDRAEKLMHESMQRPDFIEGITSFFEKRPPNFPPLKEDTP